MSIFAPARKILIWEVRKMKRVYVIVAIILLLWSAAIVRRLYFPKFPFERVESLSVNSAEWRIVDVSTEPIIYDPYYEKSRIKVNLSICNVSYREMFIWGANLGGEHNLYLIHSFVKDVKSDEWEKRNMEIGGLRGKIGWIRVDPGDTISVTKIFSEKYVGRQMILTFRRVYSDRRAYSEIDAKSSEILLGPLKIPEAKKRDNLIQDDQRAVVSSQQPALVWRDADTRNVIFTSDDIITFDWDKQVFHLTDDAIFNFCGDTLLCSSPGMIVEDEDGPIYETCWYNPYSSSGCGNSPAYKRLDHVYLISLPAAVPIISIESVKSRRKYNAENENDRRFDPRLKAGLEKAGVIGAINLDSVYVELISISTGSEPYEVGEDLKVWVEIYRHIRFGRKAWFRTYFRGGEKTLKQINSIAFEIKIVANNGTFRSNIRIDQIPADVIEDGRYYCKFEPWQPAEGSDKYPESGPGFVSMTILFLKGGKDIYRLEIPEDRAYISGKVVTD